MTVKQNRDATRKKIIIAAIECTESKGIHSVTVRDIARRAEVNIAAINYYFGSKEKLLEEMLAFTLYDTVLENITEFEEAYQGNPYATVKAWLMDFLQGMMRFPNISKAHMYGPMVNSDYSGVFVEWINGFCITLEHKIAALELPHLSTGNIKLMVTQLIAAVFFPGLVPDLFESYLDTTFSDSAEKQEQYVDLLLSSYLGIKEQ